MHIGIIFLQNIVFFDLMLLLLIFYDFDAGSVSGSANWLRRAGPVEDTLRRHVSVLLPEPCAFSERWTSFGDSSSKTFVGWTRRSSTARTVPG